LSIRKRLLRQRLNNFKVSLQGSHSVHEGLSGVERSHLATAHTSSTSDSESDVTRLTPAGTPGVLNEVELGTVLLTPTDNDDGVVKGSTARAGVGEDTTAVTVEVSGASINGDGDRLLLDGILEGSRVVLLNVFVGLGTNETFALVVFARSVLLSITGVVRVVGEGHDGVCAGVFVTSLHVTTVATTSTVAEVVGGATDDLLLGKLNELASCDEVGTTEGLAGGESPA